ncbi:type I toxin-antitoxin system SymE family toxin [Dickeya zeae]|uniref:type I toxin-antitoxin system SymE family toxin n=1 Tax=Dickeya zeae TaxID=204042 RepID=UPI001CFA67C1|nr:type I toxin-antitoxin system SymE family toxin [Dickeya zeae]UCZ75998.1 type I toxin-antitoxin system SymE family toxin [Dickeya zeae]
MSIDIDMAWQQGNLPELTLSGTALAQAGFTSGALFRISLYRNGLMLTRLDDDTDIAALVAELDGSETEGADWVGDSGELLLAGDWLTRSGLLTPPFSIEALPGRIMIL